MIKSWRRCRKRYRSICDTLIELGLGLVALRCMSTCQGVHSFTLSTNTFNLTTTNGSAKTVLEADMKNVIMYQHTTDECRARERFKGNGYLGSRTPSLGTLSSALKWHCKPWGLKVYLMSWLSYTSIMTYIISVQHSEYDQAFEKISNSVPRPVWPVQDFCLISLFSEVSWLRYIFEYQTSHCTTL